MTKATQLAHGFRPAHANDLDWLLELRMQTMAGYIEASGKDLSAQDQLDRILRDFDSIQIITLDERDIGMVKVVRNPKQWQLVQIQLLPAVQGSGMGSTIVGDLVEEASSQNVPIVLSVLKVNPAKRLYERLGFCVVGEKEHSYEMRRNT